MKFHGLVICAVAVVGVAAAQAESGPYGLGSTLEKVTLEDQFERKHTLNDNVRVVLLTPDMGAGDIAKEALGHDGKSVLDKYSALYVADMSRMPAFVRRHFVLPKLKERTYPMLLDTAGSFVSRMPSRSGNVTLLFLDRMKIVAVEYVSTSEALLPALRAPRRFAPRPAG